MVPVARPGAVPAGQPRAAPVAGQGARGERGHTQGE